MRTIFEIARFLGELAPLAYAREWDHVGIQVGEGEAKVRRVLLSLDPSREAVEEAIEKDCQLVVTHHPLFFKAQTSLTGEHEVGRTALLLARHEIGMISMHTNLDAAEGGVCDALAQELGLEDVKPLSNYDVPPGLPTIGRVGRIKACDGMIFLRQACRRLACPGGRYVLSGKQVSQVAVIGGSGGEYLKDAAEMGCDTVVTADVSYHTFLNGRELGLNVFDLGHFETESVVLRLLADRLRRAFPEMEVICSEISCPICMYEKKE